MVSNFTNYGSFITSGDIIGGIISWYQDGTIGLFYLFLMMCIMILVAISMQDIYAVGSVGLILSAILLNGYVPEGVRGIVYIFIGLIVTSLILKATIFKKQEGV